MRAMDMLRTLGSNTELMKNLSVAFSFVSGAAAGAALAMKAFEKHYALLAEQEIAEARRYFTLRYKEPEFSTPEKATETLGIEVHVNEEDKEELRKAAREFTRDYTSPSEDPEEPRVLPKEKRDSMTVKEREIVSENVFDGRYPIALTEEDIADRDPEFAYIISREEFEENEHEHEQSTLTYFSGDDVLMDEQQKIIDDPDDVVGSDALVRFGYGSGDPNVVLVRNERLDSDFEILFSTGEYAQEVHGLRHEDDRPRIKKFREGRE